MDIKRSTILFSLMIGLLSCHSEPSSGAYPASVFFDTEYLSSTDLSHDGRMVLVTSDRSGIRNVYWQGIDGSAPLQKTHSKSHARNAVAFFPQDYRFLFSSDQAGNESTHLYVQEEDGTEIDLTPTEKTKANFAGWGDDGASFFVQSNERDPRYFDLYRYNTITYKRERIFLNEEGWVMGPVSPDGHFLCLAKINSNTDNDLFILDLKNDQHSPKLITDDLDQAFNSPLRFDPASQFLVYLTDAHGLFNQAWSYHMESAQHHSIAEDAWDIEDLRFSSSGRLMATLVNENGSRKAKVRDVMAGADLSFPYYPSGSVSDLVFSEDEKIITFYMQEDRSPRALHCYNLATKQDRTLWESINPAINKKDLVSGQDVHFKSFDGLEIPAILFKPQQASAKHKVPALIVAHGGPESQFSHGYYPNNQWLVYKGYALLGVNFRGSTGYGKEFHHLDDHKHGDASVKDCIWGRRYLESLDWIDSNHIGILGQSYGGYVVCASLAFFPEAFDAGIDIYGITNWIRTLKDMPPWWEAERAWAYAEIGHPIEEEDYLRSISPLFHAHNITKPLLVAQGANDPRVLKAESDDIVAALRKQGTPVEYVLFEDEGHGWRKKKNQITAAERYLRFLDTHLKTPRSD